MKPYAALALVILPHLAQAFEPELPSGTRQLAAQIQPRAHYELPTGEFQNQSVPSDRLHGRVTTRSWRIEGNQTTIRELGDNLSLQLKAKGYTIAFQCQTEECGGFDFRFGTFVLPPPDMFVDLSNYQFISARRETSMGPEGVGLLLSLTANAAMVQAVSVVPTSSDTEVSGAFDAPGATITDAPSLSHDTTADRLTVALTEFGHVVLSGLKFEIGSARLADADYGSLEQLAQWLNADPQRRIALVGHTDSEGALEPNVELSKARANAVQTYLIETGGVAAPQIEAHGVGYLAPIASNSSRDGRERNRRVEAILLSAP